eukprot:Gb_24839 [translate_table: standard]
MIGTIPNYFPWSLTIATNISDRQFVPKLALGNQETFSGFIISTFSMDMPSYPLIYGKYATNAFLGIVAINKNAKNYSLNSSDSSKIKGKIVICDQQFVNGHDEIAYLSSRASVVIATYQQTNNFLRTSRVPLIPTTIIEDQEEVQIKTSINPTTFHIMTILKTRIHKRLAVPTVAAFLAQGPNPITSGILKPNITTPRVDILASWSKALPTHNILIKYK